jgi:hypothetical protein
MEQQTKRCSKCGLEKPLSDFYVNLRFKDGVFGQCKDCFREYARERYRANRDALNAQCKAYYAAHKAERRAWRHANRDTVRKNKRLYRKRHPDKCREDNRKRYQLMRQKGYKPWSRRGYAPHEKISRNISRAIRRSLRDGKSGRSWEQIVGYALADLVCHLEAQFRPGMTWENYGEWHVDHVRPVSSFRFTSCEDPEFRECWALSNLQPLWAEENLSKGGRWKEKSA